MLLYQQTNSPKTQKHQQKSQSVNIYPNNVICVGTFCSSTQINKKGTYVNTQIAQLQLKIRRYD